jgi:hypothetical protein
MNDLTRRLRDADPVRLEAGLTEEARDMMRRSVIAAAENGPAAGPRWRQPIALAAMTVLVAFGVSAAHRYATTHDPVRAVSAAAPQASATQVQFRTPGGTRIIWTIDPAFQLGGTLP